MNRILLKLSGEALAGTGTSFDDEVILRIAGQVRQLISEEMQVSIVIGGGNFWRGRTGTTIDRCKSDSIGMMATVMNCIYVSEVFRSAGLKTKIFTPFAVGTFTELFSKDAAMRALKHGHVCFFVGGTGHPYFSTDTGCVLRALEIEADGILLAKAVDGIYDSDPKKNPAAVKYDEITWQKVVDERLQALDLTASIMAMENKLPAFIFALDTPDGIVKAAHGENVGTKILI